MKLINLANGDGVIAGSNGPLSINWDAFPSLVWLHLPKCAVTSKFDGSVSAIELTKDVTGKVQYGFDPGYENDRYFIKLVEFANGYIGWHITFCIFGSDVYGFTKLKFTAGRAYNVDQNTGFSVVGKYTLMTNETQSDLGEVALCAPAFMVKSANPYA